MDLALTGAAMRAADRRTIHEFGIPSFTLMETAGREVVRVMLARLPGGQSNVFGILCGRGNNAGDGLVIARVLDDMGFRVWLFLAEGTDRLSDDAAANWALLGRVERPNLQIADTVSELSEATVLIDAMLGTGLTAEPRAPYARLVEWFNQQRAFRVAVDLPTGLNADTGQILGGAVEVDLTVALGASKTGLLLQDGPAVAGLVTPVQIGIPDAILAAEARAPGCARVTSDAFVRASLPGRSHTDTKYTTGPAIVIGGSAKYPGAPSLAARAAARVGSGYVVKALGADTPSGADTEIPVITQESGILGPAIDRAKAVLVGPGLGRGKKQTRLVAEILDRARCPVVIDADGLWALGELNRLPSDNQWVLTPHAAEFGRLTGGKTPVTDPVSVAQEWAARWNVTLVLKGMPSVIATPDRSPVICSTGNPALATAGTGDVLAGLCVGLLAMGLDCRDAAVCATHLGGAASDRYVRDRGHASMIASDLIRQIPLLLSERFDH